MEITCDFFVHGIYSGYIQNPTLSFLFQFATTLHKLYFRYKFIFATETDIFP